MAPKKQIAIPTNTTGKQIAKNFSLAYGAVH
jgi:hypothetical protein